VSGTPAAAQLLDLSPDGRLNGDCRTVHRGLAALQITSGSSSGTSGMPEKCVSVCRVLGGHVRTNHAFINDGASRNCSHHSNRKP
jgi:hypothetical protein